MSILKLAGAAAGALLFVLMTSSTARADLDACGGIWLAGGADCKFVPGEECAPPANRRRWRQPGGAIFCGGQLLDAATVQACADEIEAELFTHLAVEVEVEAGADGASGCSVDRTRQVPGGLLVAFAGLAAPRRRRCA